MVEAVDLLKEATLKQELTRHGIAIPATLSEKRKKLKKAVKESHKTFICKSLTMLQPDPECVNNSINTIEQSVIGLQEEIKAQHLTLNEIFLCSSKQDCKSSPTATKSTNELKNVSARIEKIEVILGTCKQQQDEVAETVNDCKRGIE